MWGGKRSSSETGKPTEFRTVNKSVNELSFGSFCPESFRFLMKNITWIVVF